MHVAAGGERLQDAQMAGRQARDAEQRQPRRQRHDLGLGLESRARRLESLRQARNADGLTQPPPELRLPAGRGVLVDAA